jgi:hypothetical protein
LSQLVKLDVDAVENYRPGGSGVQTSPAVVRLAGLTDQQKSGVADGVLVCVARTNNMTTGGKIYSSWSETAAWTYQSDFDDCAAMFTLNRWKTFNDVFLLDVTMSSDLDEQTLEGLRDIGGDMYLVTGVNDTTIVDPLLYPIVPAWNLAKATGRFQLTGTRRWEIEVEGGKFGSTPYSPTLLPTSTGFFGMLDNFVFLTPETFKFQTEGANGAGDTAQTRLIRVLTKTPFGSEALEDGTTVSYDRPNNVLNPGWGAQVASSAW